MVSNRGWVRWKSSIGFIQAHSQQILSWGRGSWWGRMKNGPTKYEVLIPETCKYYIIWKNGRCKWLRILIWGYYPRLSEWALNAITLWERQRETSGRTGESAMWRQSRDMKVLHCWLCRWRKDPRAKGCSYRIRKVPEKRAPRESTTLPGHWFQPSVTDFRLPASRIVKE